MAKKYYAVRKGRTPGIYLTWADCERQVKGFGGAVYKSFPTASEAKAFVRGYVGYRPGVAVAEDSNVDAMRESERRGACSPCSTDDAATGLSVFFEPGVLTAYIDGSFDVKKGAVGSGGVIFFNGVETEFSFGTKDPAYAPFRNVAGELLAARFVVGRAIDEGARACRIYYDYTGIEMWATGAWKTNNELTMSYAAYMKDAMRETIVSFHKVAAHTGIAYNERADLLAKRGAANAEEV